MKARDESGITPLHWAAAFTKYPGVIAALVEAGADVEAQGKDGSTPLHRAAMHTENPKVIDALLAAGADARARDKPGTTPWDLVKDREELKRSNAYWRLNEARFE